MALAQLILEYLKVFLSAPPMAAAVVLVFTVLFRREIASLISRIARIKLPGGSEVFTSQQEKAQEEIASKQEAPPLPASSSVELPKNITLTPEQAQQVVQLVQSERANATLWEYRYLNFYLARSTQIVLDWLGTLQQPISIRLLDSYL